MGFEPVKDPYGTAGDSARITDKDAKTWGMILHLSLFSGYVIPLGGLIVPIVIWLIKKDELQGIDAHGKMVINFMISMFIYSMVSLVATIVLVGFLMLGILGIVAVVYPIIGAIKANDGVVWNYPLIIKFM